VAAYRAAIGEAAANAPLTQRLYDDALLQAGLEQANTLTRTPQATLLREYGHYFMLNGLTERGPESPAA
jgi:predicted Zn-dependent protease with MMP-like domain